MTGHGKVEALKDKKIIIDLKYVWISGHWEKIEESSNVALEIE